MGLLQLCCYLQMPFFFRQTIFSIGLKLHESIGSQKFRHCSRRGTEQVGKRKILRVPLLGKSSTCSLLKALPLNCCHAERVLQLWHVVSFSFPSLLQERPDGYWGSVGPNYLESFCGESFYDDRRVYFTFEAEKFSTPVSLSRTLCHALEFFDKLGQTRTLRTCASGSRARTQF